MATRIQRNMLVLFNGDGVSTTATFDVSDLCLYNQRGTFLADLKPLDVVDNAVLIDGSNNNTTPIVATLNGKGTSITFTFPSAPSVSVAPSFWEISFTVSRLSE
jgi:hypothetical protein